MNPTVYTIGEATFDIVFKGYQPIDAKVGGSVLNTSVSLGRLQIPVTFISSFGNDRVGDMALTFLHDNNITTDHIHRYEGNSRIALAFLNNDNNAQYSFYQGQGIPSLKFPMIQEGDIILFGSSHALRLDIREKLISFIKEGYNKGAIIIYDPNFRKTHLAQLNKLKPLIEENISLAHIVKGSDEDFEAIFKTRFSSETFVQIRKISKAKLICTANKHGVYVHTTNLNKHFIVPAINPISTIGAGDSFNAGIIYSLYKNKISQKSLLEQKEIFWDEMVDRSTKFAQHVCMTYDNYLSMDFVNDL